MPNPLLLFLSLLLPPLPGAEVFCSTDLLPSGTKSIIENPIVGEIGLRDKFGEAGAVIINEDVLAKDSIELLAVIIPGVLGADVVVMVGTVDGTGGKGRVGLGFSLGTVLFVADDEDVDDGMNESGDKVGMVKGDGKAVGEINSIGDVIGTMRELLLLLLAAKLRVGGANEEVVTEISGRLLLCSFWRDCCVAYCC